MPRTVAEIMNRELLGVRPEDHYDVARDAITTFGVTAVPILDADRRPLGVLSAKDLLRPGRPKAGSPAVTIAATSRVRDAARRIGETGHHELVVVDREGRAVGMVSTLDVVRALVGLPVAHPPAFPHRDPDLDVTWSDDVAFDQGGFGVAPEGPGIVLLIRDGVDKPQSILWAEACPNLRARLEDMYSLPQSDPFLRSILAGDGLFFRVAYEPDAAKRVEIAQRLSDAASHLPLPQPSAIESAGTLH